MALTVLADCTEVARHRTVADVAHPAVDTVAVVKARMTGTRGRVRRLAAVGKPHHLLVTPDSNQVDAGRVDHQVAHATDETATPDGRPEVHRQRSGVLRPQPAESTNVQAIFEVERGRTGLSRHHVPAFVVVHSDYTVYAFLSQRHLVWLTVIKSTMGRFELESSTAKVEDDV